MAQKGMTNTQKGLIVGGVILLAIGGYFLYCKYKKPKPTTKKPEIKPEEPKTAKILKDAYDNLVFEFNKDVIKPTSYPFLDEVVDVLAAEPNWTLKVEGHTDNVGKDDYNLKLSQKRAESVKKYIESKGIMPSRITAEGFGSTKPIADNKTEEGREKNRRVEFKIIKQQVTI
jgi:OOP family OmpA-OmpF porin